MILRQANCIKVNIQKETKIDMKRIGIMLKEYPAWGAIKVAELPLGASTGISAIGTMR